MFDPERDEEPSSRRYYLRLLAVMVISVAGCVALWPSVSGFSAGPDRDMRCLAIIDGWNAETSAPNVADRNHTEDACVHPSRRRLMLTGAGLVSLAAIVGGVALVVRTRTNLRHSPATLAGT